jgi:CubicO group peptidase (beta-lactamase class C family)
MKQIFYVVFILLVASNGLTGQNSETQNLIDQYLLTLPAKAEVAIAIISNGKDYYQGYKMEAGVSKPLDNRLHIFEIGSITKTFTGTLLMKEVVKGRLDLEQSVVKELYPENEQNQKVKDVQIRHLLTHTSGLVDVPQGFLFPYLRGAIFAPRNPHKFMKWKHYDKYLKKGDLHSQPGEEWDYNNGAFGLLGELVAKVNNTTWEDLLRDSLLIPLGMGNTFATSENAPQDLLVPGYDRKGRPAPYWDMDFINPAGSMKSCTADLVKWAKIFLNAQEGSAFDRMKESHEITISSKRGKMGNVWWHNEGMMYHGGATGAFRAILVMDDVNKNAVIVLINYSAHHPMVKNEEGRSYQRELAFDLIKSLSQFEAK